MKKVKIDGKTYELGYGMALLEYLGESLKTEDVAAIINHFAVIDLKKLSLSDLKKLSVIVEGAVYCGCGESLNLKDWTVANVNIVIKVWGNFLKSLPGNGDGEEVDDSKKK